MRADLLQLVAWIAGAGLITLSLVAVARGGFDDLDLFTPVVEVANLPSTPLLALLTLVLGAVLLVAATGEVDERGLRVIGGLLLITGAVWMIEPAAFAPYLGIERSNGVAAAIIGAALTAASFVPPLSIRRPGTSGATTPW